MPFTFTSTSGVTFPGNSSQFLMGDGSLSSSGGSGPAGQDGQYPNYLGEYNNGASYPIGGIVSIPVGSPYGNPGQLFIRSTNPGVGVP